MDVTDELKAMLDEPNRKARLLKAAEDALEAKITEEMKWGLPDTLSKICAEFIEAEIAPAVRERLKSQKGPIMQAVLEATDGITDALSERIVKEAAENLNGYNGRDIIKKLFT
jgi:hypothetical protein